MSEDPKILECAETAKSPIKSGRQIGQENLDRLRCYLEALAIRGEPIPLRAGQPNLSAIAEACGFDRQVLYKNEPAKALFKEAIAKMGLTLRNATSIPTCEITPTCNEAEIQARDRRIKHLEEKLLVREEEVEALRRKVNILSTEMRCIRAHNEHLFETGRRVIP